MEENEQIAGLIRNSNYMKELYDIKEEVSFSENITKLYAHTKDKGLGLVISKINGVTLSQDNANVTERIMKTVMMIEENLILVDNLWLEKIPNKAHKFYLYIAEYTKSSYRKEFGLINLPYFVNESKGKDIEASVLFLKSLFEKLKVIHQEKLLAHLKISPTNIYINRNSNEVFFGPCKLGAYEENSLWYVAPEYFYVPDTFKELQYGVKNDIWSIGCLISELFFLPCPLFQGFSQREVMRKMIETLGMPSFEDVSYMSKQEYSLLQSAEGTNSHRKQKPTVYALLEESEKEASSDSDDIMSDVKKKLFDIMMKCFLFKRSKRLNIDSLIDYFDEIEELIRNNKSCRKETKVIYTNKANMKEPNTPKEDNCNEHSNVNTNYRINYYNKREKRDVRPVEASMNKTFNQSNKRKEEQNDAEELMMPLTQTRIQGNRGKFAVKDNNHNTSNSLISVETPNRNNNNFSTQDSKRINRQAVTPTRQKLENREKIDNSNEYQNLNLELDNLVSYINELKMK